jgi:hypothetical protein
MLLMCRWFFLVVDRFDVFDVSRTNCAVAGVAIQSTIHAAWHSFGSGCSCALSWAVSELALYASERHCAVAGGMSMTLTAMTLGWSAIFRQMLIPFDAKAIDDGVMTLQLVKRYRAFLESDEENWVNHRCVDVMDFDGWDAVAFQLLLELFCGDFMMSEKDEQQFPVFDFGEGEVVDFLSFELLDDDFFVRSGVGGDSEVAAATFLNHRVLFELEGC